MPSKNQTQHSALAYASASLPFIYLPVSAVSNAIGRSVQTIYKLIAAGKFPQGDLIDTNTRRWRSDVISAWLEETAARSAAERETSDQHIRKRAQASIDARRPKVTEHTALVAGSAQ